MNTRHQSSEAYLEKVSIRLWMLQNGYNHKWDICVCFIILIFSYAFLVPWTMCVCVCICLYLGVYVMSYWDQLFRERIHTFTAPYWATQKWCRQMKQRAANTHATLYSVHALFEKIAQLWHCCSLSLNQIHSFNTVDTILSTSIRIKSERILTKTNTAFIYWHNRISITCSQLHFAYRCIHSHRLLTHTHTSCCWLSARAHPSRPFRQIQN